MSGLAQTLAGCAFLVTADRRGPELAEALLRRGATVRQAPAAVMVPEADDEALLAATCALMADPPDVVVVTTGVGFRSWLEAAAAHGLQNCLLERLRATRLLARGPKAHGAIRAAGLAVEWVAASETASEIRAKLLAEGVAGMDIVIQHHGAGSDGLDEAMTGAGARVLPVVVHRWGQPPDIAALSDSLAAASAGAVDAVVFTSAPGTQAWLDAADAQGHGSGIQRRFQAGELVAAAIGQTTAAPLVNRGITPLLPERPRLGALVRAMVAHYEATDSLRTVAGVLRLRSRAAVLDDEQLHLTPGNLELLRLLARRRGGLVTRADVLKVLPGGSRDPHAAEMAVARLREASGHRNLIRTVVRRGYRLELA